MAVSADSPGAISCHERGFVVSGGMLRVGAGTLVAETEVVSGGGVDHARVKVSRAGGGDLA